ncbi:MAG: hypothetical protein PWQ49_1240 [Methanohalophilus sp.]|nr:hypothetical protein [Methanohalophilus sp.]
MLGAHTDELYGIATNSVRNGMYLSTSKTKCTSLI